MVFQNDILAGSSGASGTSTTVHTIGQSIRFNDDDNAVLSRTISSTSSTTTNTISMWVKRGNLGNSRSGSGSDALGQTLFQSGRNASNFFEVNFGGTTAGAIGTSENALRISSITGDSIIMKLNTTAIFRDTSAWYNIVAVVDTTNDVASERLRLYVNGNRQTDFTSTTFPSKDTETELFRNTSNVLSVGAWVNPSESVRYFDGYMAEITVINGQALDPSSFGLYNDSNIWIPKDVSGLTFGTNGFHLKGETASDLGNDSSSNNNDFTTSGLASHDQMVGESPTNNFAVFNPVMTNDADFEFSEGNLKLDMNTNKSWYVGAGASMSMTSGKWYWESYWNSGDSYTIWGILDTEQLHALAGSSGSTTIYNQNFNGIQPNTSGTNDQYRQGASVIATGQGGSPGGIWMFALDMDNKKMWLGYNGTWIGSGDPAGGTNETWSSTYIASSSYTPINVGYQISQHSILTYNFGQDSTFAGNVTAGGNSDGNGIGNFKYSVPSGFLALCTKNLGS